MNPSPLSDDLQTLAAGYVLGDLSSDEMAQFQQLLAVHPELAQIVESLQETLSLLPYGLPQQTPDVSVRSRLLGTVKASISSAPAPTSPEPIPTRRQTTQRRRPSWAMRWVAAVVVGLGSCSLWLTHRVVSLQAQLKTAQHFAEIAITDGAVVTPALEGQLEHKTLVGRGAEGPEGGEGADSGGMSFEREILTVSPADTLLQQQWPGLPQLVQDHRKSLMRSQGPVDVAARNPNTLVGQFPLSNQIPAIASSQVTLLGGSHCQFGAAKGIRLTYRLSTDQTVSVYQIDLEGEDFPKLADANITLNYRNVNLILWREEDYLYALAAELPLTDLQTLAQTMEPI
ncbi:MAG: hypothetical protein AAFQ89_16495 [Cyanobacteria bacterium J06626_18]